MKFPIKCAFTNEPIGNIQEYLTNQIELDSGMGNVNNVLFLEHMRRLVTESDSLKAHVSEFLTILPLGKEDWGVALEKLGELTDQTPAQSLATIQAKAVDDATGNASLTGFDDGVNELLQDYANKPRSKAK